jgi:aspartate/glutamate racemase
MVYSVRTGQIAYGQTIGILMLECQIPYIPGMMGNAWTYRFPVRYEVVRGASINRLIYERDPALIKPFIDAGRKLTATGVKAVAGNCGFMAIFQNEMAAALDVPVFMSSLLLVPLIKRMLKPKEKVGVVTADAERLNPNLLGAVGISEDMNIVVADLKKSPHFREAILEESGRLDAELLKKEAVQVVEEMVRQDPGVKAVLLECTDIPPFACAIQARIDLPVFDINSLVEFVAAGLTRRPYQGFM